MQRSDALFDGRVGAEELADAAGNAHGGHGLGQLAGGHAAQAGQGVDHGLLAAHELSGAGVGAELALAAEPGHHDGRSKAEHDIHHDGGDKVANAGAGVFFVVFAQEAVHRVTHHPADEDHKGVHDTLNQGHGHHVAVGDVGDLVADNRLNLFAGHAAQQAGRHGNQGAVLKGAGSKRVGLALKNAHLGHADAGLVGELAHGVHNPGLIGVLRLLNDFHAGGPLGQGLADQQRNNGAAKSHDQGEAQQHAQIQAVGGQELVHPQQAGNNAQHHHHQQVGHDKQKNAFHKSLFNKAPDGGPVLPIVGLEWPNSSTRTLEPTEFMAFAAAERRWYRHKSRAAHCPPTSPARPAPANAQRAWRPAWARSRWRRARHPDLLSNQ